MGPKKKSLNWPAEYETPRVFKIDTAFQQALGVTYCTSGLNAGGGSGSCANGTNATGSPTDPLDPESLLLELPDPRTSTSEARWRSLHLMMADLPAEQRQVIDLAFFSGLSHSQIAEHLELPLGTVKTRLRLGMEKLRHAWLAPEASSPDRSSSRTGDVKESRKASQT